MCCSALYTPLLHDEYTHVSPPFADDRRLPLTHFLLHYPFSFCLELDQGAVSHPANSLERLAIDFVWIRGAPTLTVAAANKHAAAIIITR